MKRIILLSILCLWTLHTFAQFGDICSGDRLVEPIFTDVKVTESIQFGVGTSILNQEYDLLMDVYEPVGDDVDQRPLVIMAHGGSFVSGDRKNPVMVNTCTELAKRGYVAASIEYTLWPLIAFGFQLPDSTELIDVITLSMGDMKTAIRYFNEDGLNENVFNINPGLISVGGYSAGAIIACHQGMLDETDTLTEFIQTSVDKQGGIDSLGTRLDYSDEIISVINFSGSVYDLNFIDENSAPLYSAHGNADQTVPYNFGLTGGIMSSNGSGNIQGRYESLGLESTLYTFEGGGHTDIFSDAQFSDDLLEMYNEMFTWNKEQVCSIVASNEELATTELSIYPNPTQGELNFKLPGDIASDYSIDIYNQLGQLIYSSESFNGSIAQINMNAMNPGLYLAKVNFDEKYSSITRRIILTK